MSENIEKIAQLLYEAGLVGGKHPDNFSGDVWDQYRSEIAQHLIESGCDLHDKTHELKFKFAIGQILRPKLAPAVKLMVIKRHYIDSESGSNMEYLCSMAILERKGWAPVMKNARFYEIELENLED